ncbi:Hypothetical predicted protein [Octopus vulgaris]|uniref:VWFA domain-containing protein n=1 Tax=Octopus vulgaris TaxID=6645 RepID=A0AA36BW54_OCTVU|nr:Hypothetical predicted protein [Octopus vulgaris]
MTIKYLLFVVICLGVARHAYAVDLTLKSGETSNAVIDATIKKIRENCILAQDYFFLKRLAVVQMKSFSEPSGGIWRQALRWQNHLHPFGETTDFVTWSNELEQLDDCAGAQMDVLFVIDSSGSVKIDNFNKTLEFLNNIVSNLDIGEDETRVAVIRFSHNAIIPYNFGKYNKKDDLIAATNSIYYNGGSTYTDLALDLARTDIFATTTRKSIAAKVLVLVTDGQSRSEAKTVAAAKKLKDMGVTIFTIGVVNPRKSELMASASEPNCTHFIDLKSYDDIDFIVKEIKTETCKAVLIAENGVDLSNNPIPKADTTKEQVVDITKTIQSNSGTIITHYQELRTPKERQKKGPYKMKKEKVLRQRQGDGAKQLSTNK